MKQNLKLIGSLVLVFILLCFAVASGQSKKRKRVPKPKNRQEVTTMGASSNHDIEWRRNPKTDGLEVTGTKNPNDSYTSPLDTLKPAGASGGQPNSQPANAARTTKPTVANPRSLSPLAKAINQPIEIDDLCGEFGAQECIKFESFNAGRSVFEEIQRQITAGRKVYHYGKIISGPEEIVLAEVYKGVSSYQSLCSGESPYTPRDQEANFYLHSKGRDRYYWSTGDCYIELQKAGALTYMGQCKGSNGVSSGLIKISIQLGEGKIESQVNMDYETTRYSDGAVMQCSSTWKFSGNWESADISSMDVIRQVYPVK